MKKKQDLSPKVSLAAQRMQLFTDMANAMVRVFDGEDEASIEEMQGMLFDAIKDLPSKRRKKAEDDFKNKMPGLFDLIVNSLDNVTYKGELVTPEKWNNGIRQQYIDELKVLIKAEKTLSTRKSAVEIEYKETLPQAQIVFFDTETVGLPKDYDAPSRNINNWPRLVQLSWIVTNYDGEVIKAENYIIRPEGFCIPKSSSDLHGITNVMALREGKSLQSVISKFTVDVEQSKILVGHNVDFDKKIVGAEMIRLGGDDIISSRKSYCTMKGTVDFCKIYGTLGYKYPKLQELHMKLFGKNFSNEHNANVDVDATRKCFFELVKRGWIKL